MNSNTDIENDMHTDTCSSTGLSCVCFEWTRAAPQKIITLHHPCCSKHDPMGDARKIIIDLVRGIESWSSDEDGVHPDCWEAYKNAKVSIWELDFKDEQV